MDGMLLVQCRRPEVRILYFIFLVSGGFYCPDLVTKKGRLFWFTINLMVFSYGSIVGSFGYFLTNKISNYPALLYVFTISSGIMYIVLFCPSITYYYRTEINNFLNNLDDEFGCHKLETKRADIQPKKYNTIILTICWFIGLSILEVLFISANPIYLIVGCHTNCTNNQLLYLLGTPYVEHIHSTNIYFSIFMTQTILGIFMMAMINSLVVFGIINSYELHNIFVNLSTHIENLVQSTIQNLKLTYGTSRGTMELKEIKEFQTSLAKIVDYYRKLHR